MERYPTQPENRVERPHAVRAASGHRGIDILDPEICINHKVGSDISFVGDFSSHRGQVLAKHSQQRPSSGGNKMEERADGCAFHAFLSLG